jgi:hypothetical protein
MLAVVMASQSRRIFAIVAISIGVEAAMLQSNASDVHADMVDDSTAFLQTDVFVAPQKMCNTAAFGNDDATPSVQHLRKMWYWVTKADQASASVKDASEATKRFHKDFVVSALLMTCVLPWSSQSLGSRDDIPHVATSGVFLTLPSGQYLRYLSVFLLFLKHYCFSGQHILFLEIAFIMLGIILDFSDQQSSSEDDMWKRLGNCLPQRFVRLYPLYALHVIACYLFFFSSPCNSIESALGGNLLLSYASGLMAWLVTVAFGCYLVFAVLASPPENIQSSSVAMLCAGCVAMVVLPRTLAAPIHGSWAWADDINNVSWTQSSPDGGYELFFARRSLLLGLANFFLGLALARIRLAVTLGGLSFSSEAHLNKDTHAEEASGSQEDRDSARQEEDAWREFQDEAQRDMISRLSVSRVTERSDMDARSIPTATTLSE